MRQLRVCVSLLLLALSACSLPLLQTESNGAGQLVGHWVLQIPPTPTPENPNELIVNIDFCLARFPTEVEFLDDGTYVAPVRTLVWRGRTWEILENGRIKVDLGNRYAMYEYRFDGNVLVLHEPDQTCEARYVRDGS